MSPDDNSAGTPDVRLDVYGPADPVFVEGDGSYLVDEAGRRYLDFTSGIAVTALGHGSPEIRRAVEAALDAGLIHTSNLYRTRPAQRLAALLTRESGLDRAFFCNSGGEAVEASIKFARRWARSVGGEEKHEIVALRGSFHGRLFGSLALTDRPAYQDPFRPLMPGARFVDPQDSDALAGLAPERTAAIIAEPIQGEGGVRPLSDDTLRRLRSWTRENDVLLILDEVQCGLGRTGEIFAHQSAQVRPDLLALAKPLAGGLPMGAVLLSQEVADTIRRGDHGTTFGGGPLVAGVAHAVVSTIADPGFLSQVREKGTYLLKLLEALRDDEPNGITEIRGRGLMWGVQLAGESGPVVEQALEKGLLLVGAGPDVVRLLPPLTVTQPEMDHAVEILAESLG